MGYPSPPSCTSGDDVHYILPLCSHHPLHRTKSALFLSPLHPGSKVTGNPPPHSHTEDSLPGKWCAYHISSPPTRVITTILTLRYCGASHSPEKVTISSLWRIPTRNPLRVRQTVTLRCCGASHSPGKATISSQWRTPTHDPVRTRYTVGTEVVLV